MTLPTPSYRVLCAGTRPEREFSAVIARKFGLPSPLGELLHTRGITTLDQAEEFLYPQLSMLPHPERMKGMHEAVACIRAVCANKQPVFVHGDYDVDGITATALLVSFFREVGQTVFFYIPNRLEESYGLSVSSINRLVAHCPDSGGLLISVDCGITAVNEIAYARQLGLRVVVADHHEPQDTLPDADAILNPKQSECTFPGESVAGVGVAFFLLIALRTAMGIRLNLKKYLDLVALGTVADVVPLVGVNRILVRAGLEVLSTTNRFGVFSLCQNSGIVERRVLSEDISFKLAPRLNAAGRLGCPHVGVELLLANTMDQARLLADELEGMNATRKLLENEALASAETLCHVQVQAGGWGVAVYAPDCHPGVLGILASRLVDRYHRPVIVFADDHKGGHRATVRGSGRSIKGVNLVQILEQCSSVIEQYGGHAMAVGLTIKKEHLSLFIQMFDSRVKQHSIGTMHNTAQVTVDCHLLDASALSPGFIRGLHWLQPFGEGNQEPVFLLSRQHLIAPRAHKGHLLFQIQGGGRLFSGIGFNLANSAMNPGESADLVFQLKRTWYRGVERNQVHALMVKIP